MSEIGLRGALGSLAVGFGLAACAGAPVMHTQPPVPASSAAAQPAAEAATATALEPAPANTVRVRNNNWATVDIYLVRNGTSYRLGTVTTAQTAVLPLPTDIPATDIRLAVHPIGGTSDFVTPEIQWSPGQGISLSVENNLAQTSYRVG